MRPIRIAIFAAVMAALVLPQAALAVHSHYVPPGGSGVNQYTETMPGPGGNEPTSGPGGNNPANTGKALGNANAHRLEALGPEGKAAAALAAAGTSAHRHGNAAVGGSEALKSAGDGQSGLGQVLGNLSGTSDSGGMGMLLPLLVLAMVVAAGAFMFFRHRTGQTQS